MPSPKTRRRTSKPASSAPADDGSPYYFDVQAADDACAFFANFLVHSKGEHAGKPFELSDWQRDRIIRPLFGWKRKKDGLRRYRKLYLEVPRKNGKSTLAAGLALFLLLADKEPGAEVYGAAADKDQAKLVFTEARRMAESSADLSEVVECYRDTIVVPSTNSKYQALSSDVPTKHGLNPSAVIFDELHVQPNRDLYEVLTTAMGSRRQPLLVMITTAGHDRHSLCWEMHEYAQKVLAGVVPDEEFLAVIYAADEKDDWTDPAVWAKANPGFGVSVKPDYMASACREAKELPRAENAFRQLHLDQWTEQAVRWLPMAKWDECKTPLPDLAGRRCFAGLDLSSNTDLTALVLLFPPAEADEPWWILPHFWVPAENARGRERRDRVPYTVWAREGHLLTTEGDVVDYDAIDLKLTELAGVYQISEVAFDPWGSTALVTRLQGEGFNVVAFRQGFASMSPAAKELEKLLLEGRLAHGGHPVLRWCASNVAVETDPAGNIKPSKKKSTERIDGIVALVMAVGRATANPDGGASVYEERGLTVI